MEIFAIVCLTIILIGIQHLLNWGWRNSRKEDLEVFMFVITGLSFFITIVIVWKIGVWMQPLLK